MSRPFRFAPISSGPSTRLGLVIWLFRANAVIAAVFLVLRVANLIFGFVKTSDSLGLTLFSFVVLICWVGGNWWIATQIAARRRRGAVIGIIVFALSLILVIFAGHRDWLQISLAVLSLAALVSVWDELTPTGPVRDRP